MCTSFALHSEGPGLVGMNFDNDGKELRVASLTGRDITFLVGTSRGFVPSFGVSSSGIFVNDLMADETGQGRYSRQNDSRWVSTRLVQTILGGTLCSDEVARILSTVEVVNNPGMCSHNLIVCPDRRCWVVEHGIRNLEYDLPRHRSLTLTNFPLSRYAESQPSEVQGSGADRYLAVNRALAGSRTTFGIDEAFGLLRTVAQDGDPWKTELSLVYDLDAQVVHLSSDGSFRPTAEFSLSSGRLRARTGAERSLTKAGTRPGDLW